MYIRFEGPRGGGLFKIGDACRSRARRRMSAADRRRFDEHFGWLWENTPAPGADVYCDTRSRRPRTWFRPTAREHIRRGWMLCDPLCGHGVRIRPVMARDPGTIIWEDPVQVIVRPGQVRTVVRPPPPCERRARWSGDRATIRMRPVDALRRAGR
ncbi:MAG: hypothetical protein WD749_13250 [Phycisphaerales bacterium]